MEKKNIPKAPRKKGEEKTKANRGHEHVQEQRNKNLMKKGRLLKK